MVKPVATAGQMLLKGLTNIRQPALRGALENLPAVPITRSKLKKELQAAGVTRNELVNAAQQFEYDPANYDLKPMGELLRSLIGNPTKADKKVVYQPRDLQPMVDLMEDYRYTPTTLAAARPLQVEMKHKRDAAHARPGPYKVDHEPRDVTSYINYFDLIRPSHLRVDGTRVPIKDWAVPIEKWPLKPRIYRTERGDELPALEEKYGKPFQGHDALMYQNISFGNRDDVYDDIARLAVTQRQLGGLPQIPRPVLNELYPEKLSSTVAEQQFPDLGAVNRRGIVNFHDLISYWTDAVRGDIDGLSKTDALEALFDNYLKNKSLYTDNTNLDQFAFIYFDKIFKESRKHTVKTYPTTSLNAVGELQTALGIPIGEKSELPYMVKHVFDKNESALGFAIDDLGNRAKKSFAGIVPYRDRIELGYELDPKAPVIDETYGGTNWMGSNLMSKGPFQQYSESVYQVVNPRRTTRPIFEEPHWRGPTGQENVFGHTRQSVGRPLLYEGPDARTFHLEELQPQFAQSVRQGPGTLEAPRLFNTPDATKYLEDMRDVSGFSVNVDPAARMSLDEITELKPPMPDQREYFDNYTLTHPALRGVEAEEGITFTARNLDDARKQFAEVFNQQQINYELTDLTDSGFFTPHPYASTNPAEQFLARGALQQAIDSGADFMTWPMRGREFGRRNSNDPGAIAGQQAEYNVRLPRYYNKLAKPYDVRVGHDRLITYDDPIATRVEYDDYLQGGTGWDNESARDIGRIIADRTERVHKLDIRPMRDIFKKGIPLSITGGVLSSPVFSNGEQ